MFQHGVWSMQRHFVLLSQVCDSDLTLDSILFPSLSRIKRAFTVYREGSCNSKWRDHRKYCSSAESPRGSIEDQWSFALPNATAALTAVPSTSGCVRFQPFIIHVHPAFAATPCFTSNLMSAPPRLTAFSTQPEHARSQSATSPQSHVHGTEEEDSDPGQSSVMH